MSTTITAWRDEAICSQTDPAIFYPENGGSVREAKLVCDRCPVRRACLDHAIRHREVYGVWGGLSETECRHLTRR